MPFYRVQHVFEIKREEKDAIAAKITEIHSRLFDTPTLFVNVQFEDIRNRTQVHYVGGQRVGHPIQFAE